VTVETRGLEKEAVWPAGSKSYWKKAAVINYLYAKQHGHDFLYIHVDHIPEPQQAWTASALRPHILEIHVSQYASDTNKWGVYLDSDAVVAKSDIPLESLYEDIAQQICKGTLCDDSIGLILELDAGLGPARLNTGVMVFAYNNKTTRFLQRWVDAQMKPENRELLARWPADQRVFEKMVGVPDKSLHNVGIWDAGLPTRIGIVRPHTMASPWAKYISHLWSGWGWWRRETVFDQLLGDLGIATVPSFNRVLDEINNGSSCIRAELTAEAQQLFGTVGLDKASLTYTREAILRGLTRLGQEGAIFK